MSARPWSRRLARSAVAFGALALVVPVAVMVAPLLADEKPAEAAEQPSKLARELVGTWVLAGTPDKVVEPPASGGRYHFFTGKHWAITQADPDTGVVIFHHGGTYTLDGDQLVKTVVYANPNTANLIKEAHKFKVKVEGDTFTQVGIDNPWTEVWKRAK